MSLGLPDFGSRSRLRGSASGILAGLRLLGFVVFAYTVVIAVIEGRLAYQSRHSMEEAEAQARRVADAADAAKRALKGNADLLVATSSVESSPERILEDLKTVLPAGVSVVSLKIEYLPEAAARLDLEVVARGPEAYDRFLSALAKSPRFAEIRPGAESRPGPVRASVEATHRPKERP